MENSLWAVYNLGLVGDFDTEVYGAQPMGIVGFHIATCMAVRVEECM
jgi:hypothetical protein